MHTQHDTTVFDYAALLASIQQVAPEAHIAGGAVRDTILKKPIKDVDVFLADENLEAVAAHLRPAHAYVKVGEWKEYLGFADPAMTRLAKFERADATIPVCLIGLKPDFVDPTENMSRFDFGLCMAAFDGTAVMRTAAFNDDAESQTFTLHRADNAQQFAYSMSRFEKLIAERYAGWRLAVPKEFVELAKDHTMRRTWFWDERDCKFGRGEVILRPKAR
jgi:hypothetical protein